MVKRKVAASQAAHCNDGDRVHHAEPGVASHEYGVIGPPPVPKSHSGNCCTGRARKMMAEAAPTCPVSDIEPYNFGLSAHQRGEPLGGNSHTVDRRWEMAYGEH